MDRDVENNDTDDDRDRTNDGIKDNEGDDDCSNDDRDRNDDEIKDKEGDAGNNNMMSDTCVCLCSMDACFDTVVAGEKAFCCFVTPAYSRISMKE